MWIETDSGSLVNLSAVESVTKSIYCNDENAVFIFNMKSGASITVSVSSNDASRFQTNLKYMLKDVTPVKSICSEPEED